MYNFIIDHFLEYDGAITEPVTVEEAKLYCRVTNTIEDDLFAELIIQSREAIEKVTNLSLVPKIATVWFTNAAGMFQFQYGPMQEFTELLNAEGDEIDPANYRLVGGQYPSLARPLWAQLKATYSCGFPNGELPTELKIAMLDQINYGYENRGMDVDDMGVCEKTWRVCQRWTRTSPIL
jgi:uncharacterized phiE125 gp8 family phage protein